MPTIVIYPDYFHPPRIFPLMKKITTIGTNTSCDIVVKGEGIREFHAHILEEGQDYKFVCIEKDGNVKLNGKGVTKAKLNEGDIINIGDSILKFLKEDIREGYFSTRIEKGEAIKFLNLLHEFSEKLMESKDVDKILAILLDETLTLTKANKGFIILVGEDGKPKVRSARNILRKDLPDDENLFSDSIIQKVIKNEEPIILSDVQGNNEFSSCTSVINLQINSVLCFPLKVKGETIGVLYLGGGNIANFLSEDMLNTISVFASQASLILQNAFFIESLSNNIEQLKEDITKMRFGEIIGACDSMKEVFLKITKVAPTDVSVLITGETGTGKELIAREIHRRSSRAKGSFIPINCGAIPENLLESELFGHLRGSFTGAYTTTLGKFHIAQGGTLFLDEIGELPLNLQVKILRAIQEKEIVRVGSTKPEKIDVRIVAASNRDLEIEVKERKFREDLYYRLNVVTINLPPLRERKDDIILIARYYLQKYCEELKRNIKGFSPAATKAMLRYEWQGNIRELENKIKKAVIFCESSFITTEDLELKSVDEKEILPLSKAKENFERNYILEVLRLNNGNRVKTAKMLEVDPRTIFRYLEKERERNI